MPVASVKEWKERGNEAYKTQRYDEAIRCYTEAINTSTSSDDSVHLLYANRAAALLAAGEYSRVKDDCEKCLELEPKFVKAYLRLATALYHLQKFDEAIAVISKGMALGKEGGKKAKKNAGIPEFKKLLAKIKAENKSSELSTKSAVEEALLAGGASQAAAVQEIQEQVQKALLQQGRIERQAKTKQMQQRMNELTRAQIEQLQQTDRSTVMYQAVGRMFLQRESADVVTYLKEEKDQLESELAKLKKASTHYQREINNARSNLKELVPGK